MELKFVIERKYVDMSIYNYAKVAKLVDENFDINDIQCEISWGVEIAANNYGITDFIIHGKAGRLSFEVVIWQDNSEDEIPKTVSIDASNFEVKFDLEFNDFKQLSPSNVDIDLLSKTIQIS